jgi:hypothetical protein
VPPLADHLRIPHHALGDAKNSVVFEILRQRATAFQLFATNMPMLGANPGRSETDTGQW